MSYYICGSYVRNLKAWFFFLKKNIFLGGELLLQVGLGTYCPPPIYKSWSNLVYITECSSMWGGGKSLHLEKTGLGERRLASPSEMTLHTEANMKPFPGNVWGGGHMWNTCQPWLTVWARQPPDTLASVWLPLSVLLWDVAGFSCAFCNGVKIVCPTDCIPTWSKLVTCLQPIFAERPPSSRCRSPAWAPWIAQRWVSETCLKRCPTWLYYYNSWRDSLDYSRAVEMDWPEGKPSPTISMLDMHIQGIRQSSLTRS